MAAVCVERPGTGDSENGSYRQRILKWKTRRVEKVQRQQQHPNFELGEAGAGSYHASSIGEGRRYCNSATYTANFPILPASALLPPLWAPTARTEYPCRQLHERVSALVADLLRYLSTPALPSPTPAVADDDDLAPLNAGDEVVVAHPVVVTDHAAPRPTQRQRTVPSRRPSLHKMDFKIDFGDNTGFQTRGNKKKKGAAARFDPWGEDENKAEENGSANGGAGGGDGSNGGGGDAGSGGGGDDNNNGGGGDDDDWGFSTGKKGKKKTKKQLEEEQKKKEEEEAAADTKADPLSWADDANEAANDDWSLSWSTGKKAADKKKKKGADVPPTVPEVAPTSAFQDISLDDTSPKLDFSFDNVGGSKKGDGSGFSTWGKTWDFGTAGKAGDKKDDKEKTDTASFGDNNPWSFGNKKTTKKTTTTMSSFDFGDFGGSGGNDLSFAGDDLGETKATDDAWGFASAGKKDTKKKKGGIEEIQEEPRSTQSKEEESWGGWGTSKTTKKKTDDSESAFDWGFGSKKDKKKDLIGTIEETAPADDGDDWMSGAWGKSSAKKTTKKKDDLDLGLNDDGKTADPPADDPWGAFTTAKDKKKSKKGLLDEAPPADPAPAEDDIWGNFGSGKKTSKKTSEPEPAKEPLVAWDAGLSAKDKKKLEKQMRLEGTWDSRVTQDMVDEQEAAMNAEPEPLEPPPPPKVAWDEGLTPKDKRKKEKEMRLAGTWDDRITQDMIDEEVAAAAEPQADPEPEPLLDEPPPPPLPSLADELPWDHGLTPLKKRKLEREMRLNGTWDSRITQEMIDEAKLNAEAAAAQQRDTELNVEAEAVVAEERVAWDHGLSTKDRRKKEKEMKLDGTWEDRVTQEMIDDELAAAAAAPEADASPEPRVAWDAGLSPKDKRKKEKEMRLAGTWDDRITQDMVDEDFAAAEAAASATALEPEPIPEPEEAQILEERVPWDHGLSAKEKKKLEKEMKLLGTWDDRLTQERIDEEKAAAEAAAVAAEALNSENPPDDRVPWDHDLSPKDKKKKEKEMKLMGTWDDRLTQEKIDEEREAAAAAAITIDDRVPWDHELSAKDKKKKEKEMKLLGTWDDRLTQEKLDEEREAALAMPDPEPEVTKQPLVAWDEGLTPREKRKLEKDMRADGTWDSRITQDMVDAEAEAAATSHVEPEPVLDPEPEPAKEQRKPWDWGLDAKAKKKKEREMKAFGTWEERLTQEQIDADAEAEAAAEAARLAEPEPVKEERKAWDHGLDAKAKKKKEREMKAFGTWEDRLTQETIDAEAEAEATRQAEPEPVKEERKPWDFGLDAKAKKKKEREMKAFGTWEDRLTQEMIDEEAAAAAVVPTTELDTGDGWSFGWGGSKSKKKSEPAKEEEIADEGWGNGWGFGKDTKKKSAFDDPAPVREKVSDDIWDIGVGTKDKKKKAVSPAEDDIWATFGAKPIDSKVKKGKKVEEAPPPAPSPPALGLTPEPDAEPTVPSVDDFDWAGLGAGKATKKTSADDSSKKSSMWGFGTSSATKLKKEKDAKAKKEAEEQAQREAEEAEAARIAAEEEAAAKAAKKSTKLGKTSKVDEKKKSADLLDLLDEPIPTSASSKLKKSSTKTSDPKLDLLDEPKESNDYFGFWGSSATTKKTTGKKDSAITKEIKSRSSANDEDALADLVDDLDLGYDDKPTTSSSKLAKTMSNGKPKVGSSIAERIRALESKKDEGTKKSKAEIAPQREEPALETELVPKEEKKAGKSKATPRSSKAKIEEAASPPVEEKKRSKESVPGSFPDDLLDIEDPSVAASPEKSKTKKGVVKAAAVKPTKTAKPKKPPVELEKEDESVDDPKLSLSPDEDDKKSTKKERPRVERSATSSWGFWGAAPPSKKPVRSKTTDEMPAPEVKKTKAPPAVTRTKSTRTPREKELEDKKEAEKASKSSGSDKESGSKQSDRPKASRGMSLSGFLLGTAPPSAMKPQAIRRSSTGGSKTSSRRQSVDHSGIVSPAEVDSPINDKAAKLMGMKSSKSQRRSSVAEKSKSYADPYPIDDDDMVMIHAADKEKSKDTKVKNKVVTNAKRASTKPRSKTLSGDEEVVMVDSPAAIDSGVDDLDSPSAQRTPARKSTGGFFSNFFGGRNSVPPPAEKARSTPPTDVEDNALPIRTKSTSQRRSKVLDEGLTTDAPADTDADAEARKAERRARRAAREKVEQDERDAREQRRRERRDREKADLEARQRQAKKEQDLEEQRKEERRARRREKEAARAAQEQADADAAAEKRREERRRLRDQLEAEANETPVTKEERRRTYADEEDLRRKRRDDKDRRSRPKTESSSRRKSTALMDEYHNSRSGTGRGIKPPADKTSSWIDSQQDEPPDLPPVEGTVLDPSGQTPRPVDGDADPRRRRKDKYAGMTEDDIAARRERKRVERRMTEKSTSQGSDEKNGRRSARQSRVMDDDYYGGGGDPVRTFDGRPTVERSGSRRNSGFFGRFF